MTARVCIIPECIKFKISSLNISTRRKTRYIITCCLIEFRILRHECRTQNLINPRNYGVGNILRYSLVENN